jgi:hypothetical protein
MLDDHPAAVLFMKSPFSETALLLVPTRSVDEQDAASRYDVAVG